MVQGNNATGTTDAPARGSFPIVAVGASAGGLAPTVELVRELGPQPGIAVVVIHHLDPTHESGLVEILARATALPVVAATDGIRVERDHLYVLPPNAGLLIRQGVLKIVPRQAEGGLHLPIDRFFESLALDRDGLAVGVVLSGSGFDGTEGIRAIKREGGITLAQDTTAAFGSMPESAIATGCVDFILPPGGLARELLRIGAHGTWLAAAPPRATDEPEYRLILAAMQKASGVDFASYKHSTIQRRIQRRLFLCGLTDVAAYAELLKRDPAELEKLCEEVLIHVTGFFREPEAFEALRALVLPALCERRTQDTPIRVWVPGCSTGEEVYSIAICLLEFLGDAHRDLPIKIFGTDISLAVIEKARAGRYPPSIEQEVSSGRLQRFFTSEEGGYRIARFVRDACVFAKHDVTRDPPFSAMDLVSCRNLMIYLGTDLQDRVVALLHYALREPGFLVLGGSETVRAFAGFVAVDGKNKVYARTAAGPRLAFDFATPGLGLGSMPSSPSAATLLERPVGSGSGPSDVYREADRLVLAEFAPPGVVVTSELAIVQFRGQTGSFLEPAPGAASFDLLRMTREALRLPLRRAIDRARSTQSRARESGVELVVGGMRRTLALEVIPFAVHSTQQRFLLVLFEDATPPEAANEPPPPAPPPPAAETAAREELAATRQYLESVIEQHEATNEELRAANEEIVSSNEELRSTNEELQSAKEELQATNEELRTVNDELRDRNMEATRLSDDLTNVLNSVEIPILIVGRDLRLRKFTPMAGKVFGLLAADLDRPLGAAQRLVAVAPGLVGLVSEVLESLRAAECTIQSSAGRWYRVSVRPYVTLGGRVDGTVVAAHDIDADMRAAESVAAARKYAEDIVETVREGLIVLDRDLRARSTNTAFQRMMRLAPTAIEGRRLDELGRAELATPALRTLLEGLADGSSVEGIRLEYRDEDGSTRVLLLNARHIQGTDLFLIALADATEAERARMQRAELGFRDALNSATEGILMVDTGGAILFANPAVARLFGYEREEIAGLSVDLLLPERLREMHVRHRAVYVGAPVPRPMGTNLDILGRRKDGAEFPLEVSLSTMTGEQGPVVVAFVTDATERRKAEREIKTYQERLQRMAFDAALTEERERRRIAIELHDWIVQDLALAQIKLAPLRSELTGDARAAVDGAVELVEKAIDDSRTLVFELSPPVLYDLGLDKALEWLATDVEKRHGVKIEIADDDADKPLADAAKAIVFRSVRELVMNVLKHAQAPAAKVSLRRIDHQLQIDVEDRGVGFDPEALGERPADRGFGLLSVREQVARLGGTLTVASAPERGTLVTLRVPLQASEASPPTAATPRGGEGAP
jgi:two-component system CheB/CheR fusion protein